MFRILYDNMKIFDLIWASGCSYLQQRAAKSESFSFEVWHIFEFYFILMFFFVAFEFSFCYVYQISS